MEYVVCLAFDPRQEYVVLIQKARPEWQRGLFNGPGGKVEVEEKPAGAAQREFREETGADITNWRLVATLGCWNGDKVYFYTHTGNFRVRTMTDEPVTFYAVNGIRFADLPVIPNLLWLIPAAMDKNHPVIEFTEQADNSNAPIKPEGTPPS